MLHLCLNLKTNNMKDFAIGVASVAIGVTIGMVLANVISKQLAL